MPWYIIVDDVGVILHVRGGAFEHEARALAAKLHEERGTSIGLSFVWLEKRPVEREQTMSLRGQIEWFGGAP